MNSRLKLSSETPYLYLEIIFMMLVVGTAAGVSALAATGPQIGFDVSAASGPESAVAVVNVVLSQAADVAVTVDFAVTGGTAKGGPDYGPVGQCRFDFGGNGEVDLADLAEFVDGWLLEIPGDGSVNFEDFAAFAAEWFAGACRSNTLRFEAGQMSGTIYLYIVDDDVVEADETIIVELSSPVGAVLSGTTRHTYTILDNDDLPTVSFDSQVSQGVESINPAMIAVNLSKVFVDTVTVDYEVTGGMADDNDFMLMPGTLSFAPGQTTGFIPLRIRDDNTDEENETIILTLSNPDRARLGSATTHTYTVLDNEGGVWIGDLRWYNSDSGRDIDTENNGYTMEWDVGQGDQIYVRLPEQRFSNTRDVVVCSFIWSSSGDTNDGCECYKDYDPDPDGYDYCTDLRCVGGTGDFRMGLFDSNGRGYITRNDMGENNEMFRGYLGYHFRIFPHVPQDAPSRFTEYKDGGGTESHTNTSIWERNQPQQNSALLSNSNSWNRIGSPMEGGFGIPVGGSALVTMRLEHISQTQARLSLTCNGKTWTRLTETPETMPQKIDVFAMWSNSKRYDYVRLTVPEP